MLIPLLPPSPPIPLKILWKELPLKEFKSSDNATLFYYKKSSKSKPIGTLLFLCGWSQGPSNWSPALLTNTYVKENYDVYIIVMRGYKNIEDNFNNNIARYAKDVVEFIKSKKLKKVTAVAHAMGCSIVSNIISLYGEKYFDSYVLIDNSLLVIQNPDWYDTEKKDNGCFFKPDDFFSFYNTCAKSAIESAGKRRSFEEQCFTPEFIAANPNLFIKIKSGTLNYNFKVANEILYDYAFTNNVQNLKNGIKKPALLIGGEASFINYQVIEKQKEFFELPTIKIFKGNEGGSNSMYIENPPLFNTTVNSFLKSKDNKIKNIQKKYSRNATLAINDVFTSAEKSVIKLIV
jgi:pimeloyl-ACP methyl ester carboxylesterase